MKQSLLMVKKEFNLFKKTVQHLKLKEYGERENLFCVQIIP